MTTANGPLVILLPPALDAVSAEGLLKELIALPRDRTINLDASNIAILSPGYLQILASALKTFSSVGVVNPSAQVLEIFDGYKITLPMALPKSNADDLRGKTETAISVAREDDVSEPPVIALSKTILTIDDSRTMRDMLKMTLANAGFRVVQAIDGEDGLNALAHQSVDLIITDINMPKLDGYGVVRAVRKDPAHQGTPILVLSTEDEQASKDIAKDAGATGWIVKPFDPDGLVTLVNKVCA